jgi:putative ABC transport system permease protein
LFLAIVALVLALVCANVAGVFLSRLHTRHHELQIRTALGCSAARLTRYCAAEGVLCAVFGGLFGVASTPPILKLSRLLPRFSVPFWTPIVVDYRALACAVALVILTAGLVGVAPAIAIRRHLARMPWREVSVTLPANRRLFVQRLLLIACQMQITIVLLTAAGLLSKTFVDAETRDLGMAKRSVLIVRLATVNATRRLTVGEQEDLCARFLHRLREIPGIVSAAARLSGPLAEGIRREGSPRFLTASLPVAPDLVTAAFFRTWSIPIVEGRAFTDHDSSTETRVTILDKETAERLFPDGHPVGQRVSLGDSASGGVPLTVVGVVGSMKGSVFANESASFYPTLYLPLAQGRPAASQLTFIIRTRGSTSAVEPFVRAAVHEVAPDFPVVSLASFASELGARTAGARLNAAVVGALAIVALIIASLGVFASVSHLVASRTREAGVRLALGAPGAHVLWTMMRPSAIATGVGVAGGIVGALAATRLIRGFLYGESPSDPTAFMFAILALTSAALLAAYIPARRLLRIDPSSALRST